MTILSHTSETVHAVAKLLLDDALEGIDFVLDTQRVSPRLFIRVADALTKGDIRVDVGTVEKAHAEYDRDENLLHLKSETSKRLRSTTPDPAKLLEQSGIIHECVHAGFDVETRGQMLRATNEACAFTAQALYLRIKGYGRDPKEQELLKKPEWAHYAAAFKVADSLSTLPRSGGSAPAVIAAFFRTLAEGLRTDTPLLMKVGEALLATQHFFPGGADPQRVQELRKALWDRPLYKERITDDPIVNFDGVASRAATRPSTGPRRTGGGTHR
jgi:hypothetical protein